MNSAEHARTLSEANSAQTIDLSDLGRRARAAALAAAAAETPAKNEALGMIADAIDRARAEILRANAADVANAREAGLAPALIDRLILDDKRIDGLVNSIRLVQGLQDPVGAVRDLSTQPSGLRVGRMRVPLGVVGMIYESRPGGHCRRRLPVSQGRQRGHPPRRLRGQRLQPLAGVLDSLGSGGFPDARRRSPTD